MSIRSAWVLLFVFWGATKQIIIPTYSLKCSGGVSDFVLAGNNLYAATENGLVEVFNLSSKKKVRQIKLTPNTDVTGILNPPNIYSVDVSLSGQKILVAAEGWHGFSDLYIYSGKTQQHIIEAEKDKLIVREARFVSEQLVLMGLLSNELVLLNPSERIKLFRKQINTSPFSDLQLNSNRDMVLVSDESGVITGVKVSDGTMIKQYSGLFFDKVFQADIKSGVILAGSQDRRIAVYKTETGIGYFKETEFPVYCVALSPNGTLGAYATPEEDNVFVFDIESHVDLYKLGTQQNTITGICFISENKIVASGESGKISFWELP